MVCRCGKCGGGAEETEPMINARFACVDHGHPRETPDWETPFWGSLDLWGWLDCFALEGGFFGSGEGVFGFDGGVGGSGGEFGSGLHVCSLFTHGCELLGLGA